MKYPHGTSFDYRSITDTIQRSLASAGLGREAQVMEGITNTIHQALASAGLYAPSQPQPQPQAPQPHAPQREAQPSLFPALEAPQAELAPEAPQAPEAPITPWPGQFLNRSLTNAAGTRAYRLYVPAAPLREGELARPLVLMLHGCKQTAGDFAVGTRMNELAEHHGFLVAYPAQARNSNGSSCWNWFLPKDQARGRGEPSILADIVRDVAASHAVDEKRVFVAGMSAGGAMAVVLGAMYPEVFAAIGVHSGLPYGAAHDVPSAFAAMKNGSGAVRSLARPVPAIVFHGERDATVHPANGTAIVNQAAMAQAPDALREPRGPGCETTTYRDAAGKLIAEHWRLAEAGHAWSGGDPRGSFTEARGPDASAEMIRFFYSLPGAAKA